MTRRGWFFVGFLLVALVLAGGVSYFASSSPDGLDATTQQGCTVGSNEQLSGSCIAQNAKDHPLKTGPLADYTVNGNHGLTGLAGVIGVIATLAAAGGLFWLLRKRSPSRPDA
jgi:cobalt/nickel transport protein